MAHETEEQHTHSESDQACISCGLDFEFDLPPSIAETAHHGGLVVFAGAGVSTEVPAVFPTTFYDAIRNRIEGHPNLSFPEVMQTFERDHGRQELMRILKHRFDYVDSFETLRRQARKFHRELATMPYLRDVVTTNWDTYFEQECLATPFTSGGDFVFHDLPGRRVYKIHGSMTTLSTMVLTEDDYARRLEELRDNALGGALRQMLATKTVVFIGYSLTDWNFRRLYDALRADMGALAPRAYFVSPFPSPEAENLGLIRIRTSGVKFLKTLKAELVTNSHFLPDEAYDSAAELRDDLLDAKDVVSQYSHEEFPAIAHCWAYQEGALDALGRIALRRGSGEYSDATHIVQMAGAYEKMCDRAIASGHYFHGAYIDGYINGLVAFLGFDDEELNTTFPLYSIYGSESAMRTEEEFQEALLQSRRRAPRARAEARQITKRLPPDMVMTHGPFLYGAGEEEE